ncbi:hypothetical protein DICPUDRAFT_86165 [Dictyostelium purpureum]|uniref:glutaminase n=1 Tax=Dictyostelium purpureum TaxID=5786 RepID=F0Z9Y7_DICPU|nr:uncharacterized protein DICPUDRAFT_86165 [Dictyostelium purpureum]EGC39233.1 hypothetical protein DICPUDRAFT_86165 [Dictyostelium purpureum]|eukprot:XP_003284260.1 hypothetical protein DICPUDRAFT_86165 [Dictyostelium purpureum]
MYKWYQSNNIVYISFNIPENVTKQDIQADISSSSISLGVKGYGLNCEGSLYLNIKSSKWAIKDGSVQVQMDKQSPGKWSQLLSVVNESNPKAIVLFDYEATADEELSLLPHEVINIISKDDSGWWEGSKINLNGVFPSNFVTEFPSDYQPPEDTELSNEVAKEDPISGVSRVGINIMGGMGSLGNMDELKNKLRKTAAYNAQELEEAISKEESNANSGGNPGFVAVQPSKSGGTRPQNRVLLNRSSQQINEPINPIQPVQPVQPTTTTTTTPAPTVQLKPVSKKEKETPVIPATTSKESHSTNKESGKEESTTKSLTSLFKKPLKTIHAISALTGSNSSEEKKIKAKVLFDFETKEPNELSLKKGDIIVILAKDPSGWWQGINQSSRAQGWFSNTFVEEIKEPEKAVKSTKTPEKSEKPEKIEKPKLSKPKKPAATPGTVEDKLQSLDETPKLESVKRVGAARNRKPPSRVRASYLLSDEEKTEREKLKQSFYSHIVQHNRDEELEEELAQENEEEQSVTAPPQLTGDKPSKPPPPKRNYAGPETTPSTAPSKPPSKPAPKPPVAERAPTSFSSSDGYESVSPPVTQDDLSNSSDSLQTSVSKPPQKSPPPIARKAPNPQTDQTAAPTNEVNFKANLKPPPRSTSPISTSQEIEKPSDASTTPTPFGLKKVPKPVAIQTPPSEGSTTNTAPKPPPSPENSGVKPAPISRPPLKKAPLNKSDETTIQSPPQTTTSPTQSSPPNLSKPKVVPRAPPSTSPNSLSTPSSPPLSSSNSSIGSAGPPPLASPSAAHKRNPSNPLTSPPATASTKTKPLEFSQVCQEIANICSEIEENSNNSQEPSTFKHIYPPLPESFLSIAVCSVDGQFWGNDDAVNDQQIPMFQAIYPFLYSILCEEIGIEEVSKYIDDEIKDESDAKPVNDQKKPHNPFTLAGHLVTSHLFTTKYPNAVTRIYQFLSILQQLVNSNNVSCDMISYLSQKSDSSDELLVAHLLKSSNLIKQSEEVLEFFYQLNSIQLNSKQISLLAATLASGGICPFSPQLKLAPQNIISKTNETIKKCDTILSSQIESLSPKIIPVISDSGILMLIIPKLMGITIVSPCIFNSSSNLSLNDNHIEFIKKLNNILK